ncbi:MAG: hypothetical protein FWH18_08310 [Marinilabiliaceae bacterium]|nr:hypothetical protein [Marinilabiliaceae bacterium]
MKKDGIFKKVFNKIYNTNSSSKVDTLKTPSPEMLFGSVEGLTIRKINIVQLKPFGDSVKDNITREPKWSGKAANALHIDTREFIVRNMLLFSEGELADGFKLAHSERYIRSVRYINDVRIIAVPVSDSEVDVTVMVQDAFPYSASFGTNLLSNGNFSVTNRNIVGAGIDGQAGVYLDTQKEGLTGYSAMLRSTNIRRTFTTFHAEYLDKFENQRYGFGLQRDFYSPTTKYAGHLIFNDTRTPTLYHAPAADNRLPTSVSIRYNLCDAWLGRSFEIIDKSYPDQKRKNLTLSLRAQRLEFTDRPENSENLFYRFQNRTTYLASLSWSKQMFYKTSMMYHFGRTEDIPYGDITTVTYGREMNENYWRTYLGVDLARGYFIPDFGYVVRSVAFGTFFRNKAEQGIIDIQLKYITNLTAIRNWRMRTYINARYTGQLFDNLEDRFISDIQDLRNDTALGRHRLSISLEQCFFTPLNIYDFRFVIYAFAHVNWLDDFYQPVSLNNIYSSFGLGVRIRNNRLIIKTIQIKFAYFHNGFKPYHFKFSSEDVLHPRDFRPVAPEVAPRY